MGPSPSLCGPSAGREPIADRREETTEEDGAAAEEED